MPKSRQQPQAGAAARIPISSLKANRRSHGRLGNRSRRSEHRDGNDHSHSGNGSGDSFEDHEGAYNSGGDNEPAHGGDGEGNVGGSGNVGGGV